MKNDGVQIKLGYSRQPLWLSTLLCNFSVLYIKKCLSSDTLADE